MGKQRSAKQKAQQAAAIAFVTEKREAKKRLEGLEEEVARLRRLEEQESDNYKTFEGSTMQTEIIAERAEMYEKAFRNAGKKEKKDLKKQGREVEQELTKTKKKLETAERKISDLHADKENLNANVHCLNKKIARAVDQKDRAVDRAMEKMKKEVNTFKVKQGGIMSNLAWDVTRNLVAIGLKPGMVGPAVNMILTAAGVEVKGNFSHTTVRCAVIEGGVTADLQLVKAMKESDGFTVSGDGLTHQSINYESHFITVNKDGTHKNYFAGLTRAPTHTSQEQCDAWEQLFRHIIALYNASPLGKQNSEINLCELIRLLTGMQYTQVLLMWGRMVWAS
ncbi:hypothetical protein BT96DRAFT_943218 [Gymnopus androsaceus JB14]|uniref:Uncharacterized protein n=1 Tax=Gymnopus androsaceus JB14 TaxID=1447944 RepID=A0A6A4H9U2_9AGAR|nr:hypothetical protein BT96DRAFT_943218 [Gymnopus androsaceus JB14]